MAEQNKRNGTFDLNVQGLKSKVKLEEDGSDKSELQFKAAAEANIDAAEREQEVVERIHDVIDAFAAVPSDKYLDKRDKLLGPTNGEKLTKQLMNANKDLKALARVNPDVADKLYTQLAETIINNDNIGPWRDKLLSSAKK